MPANALPSFDLGPSTPFVSPFELRVKPVKFKIGEATITLDPIEVEFAIQDIQSRLGPEQGVKPTVYLPELLLWMKTKVPAEVASSLMISDVFSIDRVCRRTFELAEKKLDTVLKSLDSSAVVSTQSEQQKELFASCMDKSNDLPCSTNTDNDSPRPN
jgi:hypothetical protein